MLARLLPVPLPVAGQFITPDYSPDVGLWALPAKKDASVETLRGLAILLLVAGHVVGSDPANAMQVPDESPWRLIYTAFEDIRMPLFTVISGYLYGLRPARDGHSYRSVLRSKVRRLLVPMVVVSTLVFWLKLITPGTNQKPDVGDFWRPYFFWFDHLWFLQAIFLVFLVVGAASTLGFLEQRRSWALLTGAAFVLYVLVEIPDAWNVFSLSGALRLLPFFLVGYGLSHFGFATARRGWPTAFALLFAGAYAIRLIDLFHGDDLTGAPDRLLAVAIGVPAVCLLFWLRKVLQNHALAWIGGFAFGIYLLHWFAYSAARIGLRAVGIDDHWLIFTAGLVAGVGLPIVFQLVTRNVPAVRLLMFGERYRGRDRATRESLA